MEAMTLRVHDLMTKSLVNGPGPRAVIWVQGCTLACPGCFNPETHPRSGGRAFKVRDLAEWLLGLGDSIEGVTISGGEPLQQPRALTALLRSLRERSSLSTVLFTGYERAELAAIDQADEILGHVDVLVSGRYRARRSAGEGLRGSANQRVDLLTSRYRDVHLELPSTEIVIDPEGWITQTGIDPVTTLSGG